MSKLDVQQHIEIDLEMDELTLTAAEKKATYNEIKAYVLEHTGLKVSSLYIAQVKQKYGIIERESYNKPKLEDTKRPQCLPPPEKDTAILDALLPQSFWLTRAGTRAQSRRWRTSRWRRCPWGTGA